jgi:hypothetical protein
MWRNLPTEWEPLSSEIDGIRSPSIEIVAGGGGRLVVLVSEWRDRVCTRIHSVEFDRPEAYCAVEEAMYSIRTNDPPLSQSTYLRAAALSSDLEGLRETRELMSGRRIELRQYLLVGLNECLEVVCVNPPRVSTFPTYEAARTMTLHEPSP